MARIRAWVGVHGVFKRIQRQVGGGIAGAVHADLQPAVVQGAHCVFEVFRLPGGHIPAHTVVGLVAVGHLRLPVQQELIAGKTHETVGIVFNLVERPVEVARPFQCIVGRAAQVEGALDSSVEIGLNGVHTAHIVVMVSGYPYCGKHGLGADDILIDLFGRGQGRFTAHIIHGAVVVKHAGGHAVGVCCDQTALGAGDAGTNAGDLERHAVGRAVMSAHLEQPHRIIW